MCMVRRVVILASQSAVNKHLNLPPPSPKDDPNFNDDIISHIQKIIRRPCEKAPKPKMCATIRLADTVILLNPGGKGPPPQQVWWTLTPVTGKVERSIKFEGDELYTATYEDAVQALHPDLTTEGWIHKEPGPWESPDVIEMLQYPADVEQQDANRLENKKRFQEFLSLYEYE